MREVELMSLTGTIYVIRNDLNNKVYVGQTRRTLQQRLQGHFAESKTHALHGRPLHIAIRTLGKEHFWIEPLEENVPLDQLDSLECEYINKYDSVRSGYNKRPGNIWNARLYDYLQKGE